MFLDILQEVAQDVGKSLNDAGNRSWLTRQINNAAREIYSTEDLFGCEREQIILAAAGEQQITLPWYVESILGLRNYDTRKSVELVDMRPRYSRDGWKRAAQNSPTLQYRLKGEVALSKELSDEAGLVISLPDGVSNDKLFSVTIVGSNSQASRVTESLIFKVGDTSKATSNFFSDVTAILKSSETSYDLTVVDVGDSVVAFIPCHLRSVTYKLLQVLDRTEQQSQDVLLELLFKHKFEPFVNDTDCFVAGSMYDKAIYWKTMEHIYAKQDGKADDAAMCGQKAQALIANIISNSVGNKLDMQFAFGPNSTLEALEVSEVAAEFGINFSNTQYPIR